jgi:DNA-binding response OmpR family regulator
MTIANNVLIVDDDQNLRRSLALVLERGGYHVITAANAQDAMQALHTEPIDLVFLDIKLPDQNGIALLPQIRRLYSELPVLILTAHATLDTAMEAVRGGARDYLLKPIDPPHILTRVREVLAEQEQPKKRRQITSQIQTLIAELHHVEGGESPITSLNVTLPPTDPGRFLSSGSIKLDLHTRHVFLNERYAPLPPSAFDYLTTLVRHSPDVVPYEMLVMESQGYKGLTRAEAREVTRWQIHELRKALEEDPRQPHFIFTVRDVGYRLVT